MDKIGEIRRAYFEQGRPIKEIVRALLVSDFNLISRAEFIGMLLCELLVDAPFSDLVEFRSLSGDG